MSVNLEMFCDPSRPAIGRPFSVGTWSYATNGAILVRVPRRDDVAENPAAPNEHAARLCEIVKWPRRYRPVPRLELSEPFEWEEELECHWLKCGWFRGRGKVHECPDCKCECPKCSGTGQCPHCHGTGKYTRKNPKQTRIGSATYTSKYLAWLQSLPDVEIWPPRKRDPLAFRFCGGEGLLMPCER
jgi:hypothetical protein